MTDTTTAHAPRSADAPERSARESFSLEGRVALITGGAGMLGVRHAEAVAEMGGIPVLVDLDATRCEEAEERVRRATGGTVASVVADVTSADDVRRAVDAIASRF